MMPVYLRSIMEKSTRNYLGIALVAILLQFIFFKYIYPFPGFFTDSYTYLDAAIRKDRVSYRPIGYSWFLRLVHTFSHSATVLVFVQYFLLQTASLFLFLTLRQFYGLSRTMQRVLFVFLLFNPVTLYIANSVSSDALFTSLGLAWFVELLWLIHRPTWRRLSWQAVLLLLVFYVRFNALCYPLIATVAILLTGQRWNFRLTGIACSFGVLGYGIFITAEANRMRTGTRQFSGFSGWQMANNAIHIYPYTQVDTTALPSGECRELDRFVKKYFDSAGASLRAQPHPATTDYMWSPASPLKQYFQARKKRENGDYYVTWCRTGAVMARYGNYLTGQHPFLFARYYLLTNAGSYFYPPLEILRQYNEGQGQMDRIASDWFHYKTTAVTARSVTMQGKLLAPFAGFYLGVHVLLVILFAGLLFSRPLRRMIRERNPAWYRGFLLVGAYAVVNAAFSIYATPGVFRYQVITLVLLSSFALPACEILLPALFARGRRVPNP